MATLWDDLLTCVVGTLGGWGGGGGEPDPVSLPSTNVLKNIKNIFFSNIIWFIFFRSSLYIERIRRKGNMRREVRGTAMAIWSKIEMIGVEEIIYIVYNKW